MENLVEIECEMQQHSHGRMPRALRLRHVLAIGFELFTERGYTHASMDELARRARVSKPVIYDLVGSKQQLFHTCMAQFAAELADGVRAAVASESEPEQRLRAAARSFFGFVEERRDAWRSLLSSSAAPVTEEIAAIRKGQAMVVAGLFVEAAAEKDVRVEPALIEALAHAVNGAFEAVASWWSEHPSLSADELAKLCTALLAPGLATMIPADKADPTA